MKDGREKLRKTLLINRPPVGNKKYSHGEAYCLMLYKCKVCEAMEILWNSRDGVTPFSISCRNCNSKELGPMTHSLWQLDTCIPDFKPYKGMRIFVDLTEERALEFARKRVDKFWEGGEYPMKEQWKTKDEAIKVLAGFKPGEPDIKVVE